MALRATIVARGGVLRRRTAGLGGRARSAEARTVGRGARYAAGGGHGVATWIKAWKRGLGGGEGGGGVGVGGGFKGGGEGGKEGALRGRGEGVSCDGVGGGVGDLGGVGVGVRVLRRGRIEVLRLVLGDDGGEGGVEVWDRGGFRVRRLRRDLVFGDAPLHSWGAG